MAQETHVSLNSGTEVQYDAQRATWCCVKKHQVTCCTWQKSIITWYYKGCKIKSGDVIYLVQTHGLHILHDHPQICDDFKVISFPFLLMQQRRAEALKIIFLMI